jgi:hypothetical protein
MARPDTTQFQSLLGSSRAVSLLLPESPTYDQVASATAFKLAVEAHLNKEVTIACASPMTVEFNRLVGVDSITVSAPSSRSLIISFPDQTESVDRINYDLVHGQLQLVVIPKAGAPLIDPKRLKFSGGTDPADLVITFGVNQLTDLGELYSSAKDFFTSVKLVSFTRDLPRQNFTPYQIYDSQSSCLCELVTYVLDSLHYQLDSDTASNLLAGLEQGTRQFQDTSVSAGTFEAATVLMRRGARRHDIYQPENLPAGAVPTAPPRPSTQLGYGTDSQKQEEPAEEPKPEIKSETAAPSADWYEPKIFSGSMLQ